MSQFIDRRENSGKKSMVNRQRFLRRHKNQIKRAVSNAIGKRSIKEIDRGEQINIANEDLAEPHFIHGAGGIIEQVLPGNDCFNSGDRIPRPQQNKASAPGGDAHPSGEGEDNFLFEISREEFLDIYFEELELPELVKKELCQINAERSVRAGFTSSGIPTNLNILRSMRQAIGRRNALTTPYKRQLREAEQAMLALVDDSPENVALKAELAERIQSLTHKIRAIPFLDTLDLRYNHRIKAPAASTQAVMFCIMDVSGSMDEAKKEVAKRFFILLYLFLTKNYQKIELVFIRHHTSAKEVTEEEFFYSRETGGTVVSSALNLLYEIINSRFQPKLWNIYVAQASDGDNWNADSPHCFDLLQQKIIPLLQYFAYIEIMPRHHQSLWEVYNQLAADHPQFAMANITSAADIYPVFRHLFQRKSA